MKKLFLFVVLALGACTTIYAQSSLEKALKDINRTMEELSRLHRNVDRLTDTPRRAFRKSPTYDYQTGIKFREKGSNVYYLETNELIMQVTSYSVEFFDGQGNYITSINRREYKRFKVADGLTTRVRKNITLFIENDASNTHFQFIIGDTTIMNKWAAQPQPQAPRYHGGHYPAL